MLVKPIFFYLNQMEDAPGEKQKLFKNTNYKAERKRSPKDRSVIQPKLGLKWSLTKAVKVRSLH